MLLETDGNEEVVNVDVIIHDEDEPDFMDVMLMVGDEEDYADIDDEVLEVPVQIIHSDMIDEDVEQDTADVMQHAIEDDEVEVVVLQLLTIDDEHDINEWLRYVTLQTEVVDLQQPQDEMSASLVMVIVCIDSLQMEHLQL